MCNYCIMVYTKKRKATQSDRIAKLEKTVALRKPEEKMKFFDLTEIGLITTSMAYDEITTINQGDADDQRIGSEIKITRIEVEWYSGSNGTDLWLLSPYDTANQPDPIHMQGAQQPMRSWIDDVMKVYRHDIVNVNKHNNKWTVNFPNGKIIKYQGSLTAAENSPIFWCITNYTTASVNVYGWLKVYYLDI